MSGKELHWKQTQPILGKVFSRQPGGFAAFNPVARSGPREPGGPPHPPSACHSLCPSHAFCGRQSFRPLVTAGGGEKGRCCWSVRGEGGGRSLHGPARRSARVGGPVHSACNLSQQSEALWEGGRSGRGGNRSYSAACRTNSAYGVENTAV